VLEAYSDESGIHDSVVVFALAGYVAPADEWEKFASKWLSMLERQEIKEFHTSDCEAGRGELEGCSRERRDELIARLVEQ